MTDELANRLLEWLERLEAKLDCITELNEEGRRVLDRLCDMASWAGKAP